MGSMVWDLFGPKIKVDLSEEDLELLSELPADKRKAVRNRFRKIYDRVEALENELDKLKSKWNSARDVNEQYLQLFHQRFNNIEEVRSRTFDGNMVVGGHSELIAVDLDGLKKEPFKWLKQDKNKHIFFKANSPRPFKQYKLRMR